MDPTYMEIVNGMANNGVNYFLEAYREDNGAFCDHRELSDAVRELAEAFENLESIVGNLD